MTNHLKKLIEELQLTSTDEIINLFETIENKHSAEKITAKTILKHSHYCGLSNTQDQYLLKAINIINENESYLLLFHLIEQGLSKTNIPFHKFPLIDHLLNDKNFNGNILYLLALLAACPAMIKHYKKKDTPADIIQNTLVQIRDYSNTHKLYHNNQLGVTPDSFNWSRLYLNAELFRIGRLEFRIKPLQLPLVLYKNKITNENVLFINSPDKEDHFNKINPDGFPKFLDEKDSSLEYWYPTYQENENNITGYPISRKGHLEKTQKTLLKKEWELILKKGDLILDMHIPACGPMVKDLCMKSYKEAFSYFRAKKGYDKLNCIYCSSWLLSPHLFNIIPNSNTTKLMALYYLFPSLCYQNGGLSFIFGKEYEDWSKAPQETSLQKKIVTNILNNKPFRIGSMLLTDDEVNNYRPEV